MTPSLTLIERRRTQRFTVSLLGYYVTEQGIKNKIQVVDISSSGLQFVVDQSEMVALIPHSGNHNTMSPVPLDLFIHLGFELQDNAEPKKLANESTPKSLVEQPTDASLTQVLDIDTQNKSDAIIQISCGIVYIKRQSMTQCSVGCRFEQFIGNSNERLSDYLATHQ